jgi:hypothetical protein
LVNTKQRTSLVGTSSLSTSIKLPSRPHVLSSSFWKSRKSPLHGIPTTSRTIAGSFSHSTRAYTTAARITTSSSVCEALGINCQSSERPYKSSFRTFAKSASTMCSLLSLNLQSFPWNDYRYSSVHIQSLHGRLCIGKFQYD